MFVRMPTIDPWIVMQPDDESRAVRWWPADHLPPMGASYLDRIACVQEEDPVTRFTS